MNALDTFAQEEEPPAEKEQPHGEEEESQNPGLLEFVKSKVLEKMPNARSSWSFTFLVWKMGQ